MLRREELFAEVLPQVLEDPEMTASLDRSGGIGVEQLRAAAQERRFEILRQTRNAEAAYEQAASRTRVEAWLVLLLVAAGALILLTLLATVVAYAWNEALKEAPADAGSVPLTSAASKGFEFLVGLVVLTGGVAIVSWAVYHALSPDARAGVPAAEDRQMAVSTVATYCFVALAVGTGVGTYPAEIAWQLQHDSRLGSGGGYDWAIWVTLAAWAVFALPVLLVARLAPDRSEYPHSFDRWLAVLEVAPGQRLELREQTAAEWREALRQALTGFVREQISERTEGLLSTMLTISEAPGLRQLRPGLEHVPTRAHRQLILISAGMENGSVALSGPRGVGKTQLLSVFCEGDEGAPAAQLSLVESVPVLFDRREFMLHLFYKLCERVIEEGLGTAPEAERHKRSIRYLQTHSDEAGLSAGWRSLNLAAKRATAHAQQPQTYPEIVDSLKTFLGKTALRLRQENPSRRLVIGIDELDRIEPAATARTFLNELKAVFDVPNCLFVLSVSDEALRDAELAPIGRRDAFDSAIDEVVRVEPLDQREAERVLGRRVVGLPVPFTALFYCLSGGMPRDLLRTARAAIAYVSPEQPRPLSDLAAMLVDRELDRVAHSAGGAEGSAELAQLFRKDVIAEHGGLGELGGVIQQQAGESGDLARMGATLANRAYHLDTVLRIFTTDLTRDLTLAASEPVFSGSLSGSVHGSFSALARAQREIGTADALARSTLQRVRTAWALSPLPPVPPA